jgi:hypothetical protein
MANKPQLTPAIKAEAEALSAGLDKVAALRPTLDDYVAEGVIPYRPEGKYSIPVNGKRVLQMNEAANRLAAWHGDNQAESPRRRTRREQRAERNERKFHRARATIVVPEMPWKRKRRKKAED